MYDIDIFEELDILSAGFTLLDPDIQMLVDIHNETVLHKKLLREEVFNWLIENMDSPPENEKEWNTKKYRWWFDYRNQDPDVKQYVIHFRHKQDAAYFKISWGGEKGLNYDGSEL